MKLVEEMRYKSVVIPIINGKYVSVRDAKHREVTFVTGVVSCGKYQSQVVRVARTARGDVRRVGCVA